MPPWKRPDWKHSQRKRRPLPQMHLDVAPLIGVNHDASRMKLFVVLGYEF